MGYYRASNVQGWCNAAIAKRFADGSVILDLDDRDPLDRLKRPCNIRHQAIRVQWIGALSNVIAEREAVAAQASPVSPVSDSYSHAACVKMMPATDPPQRLQLQQTHTALMQPLPETHETKTGLLWAEAEETMEKMCCVEESALPAVVSAAEYAGNVNRPQGEAGVLRHAQPAERDRQWIGFDQGNACVRKRRSLRCDVALQNLHKRTRAGA